MAFNANGVLVLTVVVQLVRERVKEMAHSRDGVASGSAPTPSPSGSGQSSTHMDLTHSDRAGIYILYECIYYIDNQCT